MRSVCCVAFFFLLIVIPGCFRNSSDATFSSLIPTHITDSIYVNPANKYTPEKAALGRFLFYDRRLSLNNTKACASCHAQEFSFTDSYKRSIGALGDLHQRNARPLINIVFNRFLTSADSSLKYPEQQLNNPMFNDHPVELGMKGNEANVLNKLMADENYARYFQKAFPEDAKPITIINIQHALAAFIRTIISFNSPYDTFVYQNESSALTPSAQRGKQLFFSAKLSCSSCHGGSNFNEPDLLPNSNHPFFNTGLYNLDSTGIYPGYDQGLIETTKQSVDMGKYRVATLRNLAYTAPYYHDGSAETLEEVISNYEAGGRNIIAGEYKGDGRKNPFKNELIKGFKLNSQERKDLLNFLLSLSDTSLISNPAYANPFKADETTVR